VQLLQTNSGKVLPTTVDEQLSGLKSRLISPHICPKSLNFPSDSATMKPEALDAFATHSIRPGALEAATSDQGNTSKGEITNMEEEKKDVSLRTSTLSNDGSI
jgi:hypothetical protein